MVIGPWTNADQITVSRQKIKKNEMQESMAKVCYHCAEPLQYQLDKHGAPADLL